MSSEIIIRSLSVNDIQALLDFEIRNREHLDATSPEKPEEFYTIAGQELRIERVLVSKMHDLGYSYGVFKGKELIGTVDLFQVERGAIQGAWLGYCIDYKYQGCGYATEAVKRMIDFAFYDLRLHRVEASAMPKNEASIRVLEKAGFHREGLSQKNVKIQGVWEDHYLYAVINTDPEI